MSENRVDIIIPLGTGSTSNNAELRFALRSIARYVPDLGKIYVATTSPPDWLQGVEIVPIPDTHTNNKDANLFDKVLSVCKNTDISDRFLIWSDDQIALKPVDLDRLNIYNERTRATMEAKTSKWAHRLIHTLNLLRQHGIVVDFNWDSHTPHLYDKNETIQILSSLNYVTPPGFCLDSLLSGMSRKPKGIPQKEVKYTAEKVEDVQKWLEPGTPEKYSWLGFNDTGFDNGIRDWLEREFPTKSHFEKYPEIDVLFPFVDPTDPVWQEGFKHYNDVKNPENHCRYRTFDNVQYVFRGIEQFMPWVRRVHFVVEQSSQIPPWLNCNNPKLRVVFHDEFIPKELLPTYNACLIELFYHRIKGLSEYFIVLNDDVFPLMEMSPECFFDEVGRPRISQKPRTRKSTNLFQKLLNNNETFLKERYGMKFGYQYEHLGYALLKSSMEDVIEGNIEQIINAMKNSPMRTESNYTLHLVDNYIIHTQRAAYPVIRGKRVELKDGDKVKAYPLEQIVCYNDNKGLNNDFDRVKKELLDVLNGILPYRSSFECEGKTMGCGCKKTKLVPMKSLQMNNNTLQPERVEGKRQDTDTPSPNDPIIQRRFWDSLKAYAAATIEWMAAGKPTRTAEEMLECFMVCQSCPYFINIDETQKRGRCSICGCYLGVNPHRFLQGNKIAMKTQHCPDGRWE